MQDITLTNADKSGELMRIFISFALSNQIQALLVKANVIYQAMFNIKYS